MNWHPGTNNRPLEQHTFTILVTSLSPRTFNHKNIPFGTLHSHRPVKCLVAACNTTSRNCLYFLALLLAISMKPSWPKQRKSSETKTWQQINDKREIPNPTMNLGASVRVNKCGVCVLMTLMVMVVFLYKYGNNTEFKREVVSLRSLLSAAIDAAERGGRVVYDVREAATLHEQSKGKTKEGANDPVTDGDIKSHLTMFFSLQKSFPAIKIISEEHSLSDVDVSSVSPAALIHPEVTAAIVEDQMVPAGDIRVWIDPLDATQEYTENLKEYVTTMVCVAVRGHPTIGVIHKPFSKSTAWAWVGKGVSPALRQTGNQGVIKNDIARIIVSRSHAGDVKTVATAAFGEKTEVIPAGGAGYKTLAVVEGKADAYVHSTAIKKWDLCAGNAVLFALHGNMTTLGGDHLDYGSQEEYKNEGGVLATLTNHSYYLQKLQVLGIKTPKAG